MKKISNSNQVIPSLAFASTHRRLALGMHKAKIELFSPSFGRIVCESASLSERITLSNVDREMERKKASIRIINYIKASPFLIIRGEQL